MINNIGKLDNNMGERYCARAIGLIFTLIGIAGFIPASVSVPESASAPYPYTR